LLSANNQLCHSRKREGALGQYASTAVGYHQGLLLHQQIISHGVLTQLGSLRRSCKRRNLRTQDEAITINMMRMGIVIQFMLS
jgi:hypothetical protein